MSTTHEAHEAHEALDVGPTRLMRLAARSAEELLAEARKEAESMKAVARAEADQILAGARDDAEQMRLALERAGARIREDVALMRQARCARREQRSVS